MRFKPLKSTLRVLTASAAILAITSTALAENVFDRGENACFQRTYSQSHMSKHPQQTVTFIQVKHDVAENSKLIPDYDSLANIDSERLIEVHVRFKGDAKTYSNSLLCFKDNKFCGVECDGGQAAFRLNGNGDLMLDVRETGGFVVEGGCDGGEENDTRYLGKAADDKLFKLYARDINQCLAPDS